MTAALLAAALACAARGLRVLFLAPGSKRPLHARGVHDATDDPTLIADHVQRWPDANLAVALDAARVVADVDDHDALHRWLQERHLPEPDLLPPTAEVRTPRGGFHRYYSVPQGETFRNVVRLVPGLDLRTAGGYVVVPPSVSERGVAYRWTSPLESIATAPPLLVELGRMPTLPRVRSPTTNWQSFVFQRLETGRRNDQLTRLVGHLLAKRVDPIAALQLVRSFNLTNCVPPLADSEVVAIWKSITRRDQSRQGNRT